LFEKEFTTLRSGAKQIKDVLLSGFIGSQIELASQQYETRVTE